MSKKRDIDSIMRPKPTTAEPETAGANTEEGRRKGILVRTRIEAWRELRQIALDEERSLQAILEEAINDFLAKHGKPPLA